MRRGNKHVPEQLMWAFLQDRVPAHNVARILEVMERAGLIKKEFMESGQGYKPMGKVQ
jgi:hypothetical protein